MSGLYACDSFEMIFGLSITSVQLYPVVGLLGRTISKVRPTDRTIFRSLSTPEMQVKLGNAKEDPHGSQVPADE